MFAWIRASPPPGSVLMFNSGGEPMVRIHLSPAGSHLRTWRLASYGDRGGGTASPICPQRPHRPRQNSNPQSRPKGEAVRSRDIRACTPTSPGSEKIDFRACGWPDRVLSITSARPRFSRRGRRLFHLHWNDDALAGNDTTFPASDFQGFRRSISPVGVGTTFARSHDPPNPASAGDAALCWSPRYPRGLSRPPNMQNTERYTTMTATRFNGLWQD